MPKSSNTIEVNALLTAATNDLDELKICVIPLTPMVRKFLNGYKDLLASSGLADREDFVDLTISVKNVIWVDGVFATEDDEEIGESILLDDGWSVGVVYLARDDMELNRKCLYHSLIVSTEGVRFYTTANDKDEFDDVSYLTDLLHWETLDKCFEELEAEAAQQL